NDALADILRKIAYALDLIRNPQDPNNLPKVTAYWLPTCNGLNCPFLTSIQIFEAGDWTRSTNDFNRLLREQPIVGAAADELRRRWKKILKAGAQLDELDPQRRHKMRIQAKKLRYASEFFSGAFPGKKAMRRRKGFVAGLEKLQDTLGDLNDIA